jgi:prevent-host-death family protein
MRTVSVCELRRNTKRVMVSVEHGEAVEITRRRRPVARIVPASQPAVTAPRWPDLEARARAALGSRVIDPPPNEQLLADRGTM